MGLKGYQNPTVVEPPTTNQGFLFSPHILPCLGVSAIRLLPPSLSLRHPRPFPLPAFPFTLPPPLTPCASWWWGYPLPASNHTIRCSSCCSGDGSYWACRHFEGDGSRHQQHLCLFCGALFASSMSCDGALLQSFQRADKALMTSTIIWGVCHGW